MNIDSNNISISDFLKNYWQKKPLLIKQGINNFSNPISPDELAGLASEEFIESRLIINKNNKWDSKTGPFNDYSNLGNDNWTLVVQSVNHWHDAVHKFATLFDFIPQWRLDDVMISFAANKGSVGPHIDNYDVFICQGSGNRHWRVGDKEIDIVNSEIVQSKTILHTKPFTAIIDDILEQGDILYIPPGFPHEGISINESMSFSVGYKSTNENELISSFADYLLEYNEFPKLLPDKNRSISEFNSIPNSNLDLMKSFLLNTASSDSNLNTFFGKYYSEPSHELDIDETNYSISEWLELINNGNLSKVNGVKTIYLETNINSGYFYINGSEEQIDAANIFYKDFISLICKQQIRSSDLVNFINDKDLMRLLLKYTNMGIWFFEPI